MAAIAPRAQLKRSRSGRQEAIFPMFVVEQCRETVRPFRCSSRNDKQESGSDQKSTDDVLHDHMATLNVMKTRKLPDLSRRLCWQEGTVLLPYRHRLRSTLLA